MKSNAGERSLRGKTDDPMTIWRCSQYGITSGIAGAFERTHQ